MERVDQSAIELQQRLAAGDDDEAAVAFRPQIDDPVRQRIGIGEAAAIHAVHADEIGVAEGALGIGAVLLAAGPQIAARETQEDRAAAGLRAFTLEGEEDLLDRVAHGASA